MTFDDAFHGGKPDTSAFKFARRMEALERPKQLVRQGGIKTRAIVLDEVRQFAVMLGDAEQDAGILPPPGELPRVLEKIHQNNSQKRPVTGSHHVVGDYKRGLPLGVSSLNFCSHAAGDFTKIHSLGMHVHAAHARKIQQVVDKLAHTL